MKGSDYTNRERAWCNLISNELIKNRQLSSDIARRILHVIMRGRVHYISHPTRAS